MYNLRQERPQRRSKRCHDAHVHKGGGVVGDERRAALVAVRERRVVRSGLRIRFVTNAYIVFNVGTLENDIGGVHRRRGYEHVVESVGADKKHHQAGNGQRVEQRHRQHQKSRIFGTVHQTVSGGRAVQAAREPAYHLARGAQVIPTHFK